MTGKKIRELRKANNLTMSELAKKSGTASSYISDLENGKIKNPSGIKLRKIAEALGVSTDNLLDDGYDKAKYKLEEALSNGAGDISKLVSNLENSAKEESIKSFRSLIKTLHFKKLENIDDETIYNVINSHEFYTLIRFLFFEEINKNK